MLRPVKPKQVNSIKIPNLKVIQVVFGTKVDSLVEPNHPIITYAKKLFSTDISIGNLLRFTFLVMAPKLANALGVRVNADTMDYFNVLAQKVIQEKRAEMRKENFGKAGNFIEMLLEAEVEENQANDGEETKSKCKFPKLAKNNTFQTGVVFVFRHYK